MHLFISLNNTGQEFITNVISNISANNTICNELSLFLYHLNVKFLSYIDN